MKHYNRVTVDAQPYVGDHDVTEETESVTFFLPTDLTEVASDTPFYEYPSIVTYTDGSFRARVPKDFEDERDGAGAGVLTSGFEEGFFYILSNDN